MLHFDKKEVKIFFIGTARIFKHVIPLLILYILIKQLLSQAFFKLGVQYYSINHVSDIFNFVYSHSLLVPLGIIVFGIFYLKDTKWTDFDNFKAIRFFLIGITFVLTWKFIFSDYNFYFNQWFIFERLLILVFFALAFRYPAVILLFLISSLSFYGVIKDPLNLYSVTDTKVLFDTLNLFVAFLFVNRFKFTSTAHFIFG